MNQHYKDAVTICKAIVRNGYEAYVINPAIQAAPAAGLAPREMDICTDAGFDELLKLYPAVRAEQGEAFARLSEGDTVLFFHRSDVADAAHPEECLTRLTSRLAKTMMGQGRAGPEHGRGHAVPAQRLLRRLRRLLRGRGAPEGHPGPRPAPGLPAGHPGHALLGQLRPAR